MIEKYGAYAGSNDQPGRELHTIFIKEFRLSIRVSIMGPNFLARTKASGLMQTGNRATREEPVIGR